MMIGAVFGFSLLAIAACTLPLILLRAGKTAAIGVVLGLVLGSIAGIRYGLANFRHYRVLHLADGLLIHRGVFWRSETFVPRSRIQHTEVNQGPLDRRWGMAKLVLHTAGTRLENISVSGLNHADALTLRDALLDRREGVDGA